MRPLDGPSTSEIAQRLTDRIDEVVSRLYPGAFIQGGVAYCSYKGGKNLGSFQVKLAGSHAGQWVRFSQSSDRGGNRLGGGALHLISYALTGSTTNFSEAVAWGKDMLGIASYADSDEQRQERDRRAADDRRAAEAKRAKQEEEEAKKRSTRRLQAGGQWGDAGPIDGTPAGAYLVNRGLPLDLIRRVCTPDVMRFGRSVHYERPPFSDHPALLGKVTGIDGKGTALGRVFLTDAGRRADLDDPKLTIGGLNGGAVRLGGIAKRIGVAEGMETALGAMGICGGSMPVWATLGTSGLAGFEVPPGVDEVVIYADGDWERVRGGRIITPGKDAATSLERRLRAAGVAVSVALPPRGKDWLDIFLEVKEGCDAA